MNKVLCIGEALIDFVAQDNEGNLQKSELFLKKAGGAPANAAGAMVKLGVNAQFFGTIGDDPFGEFLKQTLINNKIGIDYLKQINIPTTLAFVSLDKDGDRDFKFNRGADEKCVVNNIDDFKDFKCFHFGSATALLGGELENTYYQFLNYANENNILTVFDPNYRDALFGNIQDSFISKSKGIIKQSNIVKLSLEEAQIIADKEDVDECGKTLIKLGCEYLVISLGKDGSKLFYKDQIIHIPTKEVKMKDATGAGDAFIGSIIAKCLEETSLDVNKMTNIIEYASIVGAMTTLEYGALEAIPTKEQINKYIKENLS